MLQSQLSVSPHSHTLLTLTHIHTHTHTHHMYISLYSLLPWIPIVITLSGCSSKNISIPFKTEGANQNNFTFSCLTAPQLKPYSWACYSHLRNPVLCWRHAWTHPFNVRCVFLKPWICTYYNLVSIFHWMSRCLSVHRFMHFLRYYFSIIKVAARFYL